MFDLPNIPGDITQCLVQVSQGVESVADYFIWFHTLAVEAGWEESTLQRIFRQGLNPWLRTALVLREEPRSLDALIASAIWLENW